MSVQHRWPCTISTQRTFLLGISLLRRGNFVRAAPNMSEREACSMSAARCALRIARVEGGRDAARKIENVQLAVWHFIVRLAAGRNERAECGANRNADVPAAA